MSKKKAFTFGNDFERKEENNNGTELNSNIDEIHEYLDSGKLEVYTVAKNKKGTFVTVKIKVDK